MEDENRELPESEETSEADCECDYGEQEQDAGEVASTETEALEKEIAELEDRLSAALADKEREIGRAKDFNGMYVRLQSDFDNYRKRTNEQLKKTKEDGIADAMTKIIPVLDVINQALQMITDEKVAEGVRMINRQILEVFGNFEVAEIPSLGKPFDPELHNAILQVQAEKPEMEGTVIEVFQKGYRMGDRILRHSVVKVAR